MCEYDDDIALLANTHPELAREVRSFKNLERVLDWMKRRGLSLGSLDLITQDEFSHDLIVPLGQDFLVFGMS